MKQNILLFLILFATNNLYIYAQKVVINLAAGGVAEYKASDIKSIEFIETDDSDGPETTNLEDYSSLQTTLYYIIGDNNLSPFLEMDFTECCQGYLKSSGNLNLLVYKDNQSNGGKPILINVRRDINHDELVYDTLHVWEEDINSISPEIMSGIIKEAFSGKFDTNVKGLILSSHGFAWAPSTQYQAMEARGGNQQGTTDPNWFGQDNNPDNQYMEIWELRDALDKSDIKFNYIMIDACYMSNAETAYELRNCANYMIASACEIAADGYDYNNVITSLSNITDYNKVEGALINIIEGYGQNYNDECRETGELCLLDLSFMDQVAAAYKKVRAGKTIESNVVVSHDSLSNTGKPLAKIQSYGRFYVGTYYDYFDLEECALKLGDDGTLQSALKKAIVKEFHASLYRTVQLSYMAGPTIKNTSYESFPFTSCCGVSVSLPEMFPYAEQYNKMNVSVPTLGQKQSAYLKTQWGKFMEEK